MSEYISIPTKHFLDSYFKTNTSHFLFRFSKLDDSEIAAKKILTNLLKPKTIIRIPEVNYPKNIRTPDFFIDGISYEVKAVNSERSLKNGITSAVGQIKQSGTLVLDISRYGVPDKIAISKAKHLAKEHKIQKLIIYRNETIIYISNNKKA